MRLCKVTGIESVLAKMAKATKGYATGIGRGLKEGGLFVQRSSQLIVPVDTSNLKGGAFTRNVGGSGFKTDIVVGYVANYAVYVHEDMNAKHKPGKTAKYLERPAREKLREVIVIIREEARRG